MLCACGCGQATPLATQTRQGRTKGQPTRCVPGHNVLRARVSGSSHPQWRGGRYQHSRGYWYVYDPTHPRANAQGYVFEHVQIACAALGKPLPPRAQVHHANEITSDNRHANLVICEDAAYHKLLHKRLAAFRACGHPDWRRCYVCRRWDSPANLSRAATSQPYHKACWAQRHREQVARRRDCAA